MTSILVASQTKTNNQKPLVSIYWDFQNVSLTEEEAKLLVDFAKLQGRLINKRLYYNSECKNQLSAKVNSESIGFICVDVPCPLKNSADNQLIVDCINDIHSNNPPSVVLLVSGDGDFENLVLILQKSEKKVIILAQRCTVKQSLKSVANEFHFVNELPNLVSNKTVIQKDSVLPDITYDDAVQYLIAGIKTANSQGKHAVYSTIDNLMRKSQHFPNYKGFSTIRKADRTKFSSFSKFVAAVVKDGKIKLQNEEMLLV
ncbi:NYN domain-containing protein [Coleofasciculus sp. H7-2]|uniref:NYN domain-containing protein n=1 Tax=Coleofasciculus sp. H7-2 TaxID=3351545 RepID=UPI00366EF661